MLTQPPPKSSFEIGSFISGTPTANMVMLAFQVTSRFIMAINMAGSRAKSGVAATASTTFLVQKNGVTVGSFNFAIGATVATFTMAAATTFTNADELTVLAPAGPDATLADVRFTLVGAR